VHPYQPRGACQFDFLSWCSKRTNAIKTIPTCHNKVNTYNHSRATSSSNQAKPFLFTLTQH